MSTTFGFKDIEISKSEFRLNSFLQILAGFAVFQLLENCHKKMFGTK